MGTGCGGDGGYHGGSSRRWLLQLTPWQQLLSVCRPGDCRATCGNPAALVIPDSAENIGVGNFWASATSATTTWAAATPATTTGIGNVQRQPRQFAQHRQCKPGSGNAGFFNFGNGNDGNTDFRQLEMPASQHHSGNEGSGNLASGNAKTTTRDGVIRDTQHGGLQLGGLQHRASAARSLKMSRNWARQRAPVISFFNSGNSGSGFQNLGNGSSGFGNASDTSSGFRMCRQRSTGLQRGRFTGFGQYGHPPDFRCGESRATNSWSLNMGDNQMGFSPKKVGNSVRETL